MLPLASLLSQHSQAVAHQYAEYPVVKVNQRGKKQRRILGVDGEKIYNKNPDAAVSKISIVRLASEFVAVLTDHVR